MVMSGGSGQEAKIHQNPCFLFQNIRGDPMFGHDPPGGHNPSKSMFCGFFRSCKFAIRCNRLKRLFLFENMLSWLYGTELETRLVSSL